MWIFIAILGIVFLLITVRRIGNIRLQLWQIMLGGAIAGNLFILGAASNVITFTTQKRKQTRH